MGWNDFLKIFGGSAALLCLAGWLFRQFILHRLKKDLSTFNSKLDEKLEWFKSELSIISKRYEITFSKLHQTRADVIAELYEKLIDAKRAIVKFTNLYATTVDSISQGNKMAETMMRGLKKEAQDSVTVLMEYSDRKKIYFPHEITNLIRDFTHTLMMQLFADEHTVVGLDAWYDNRDKLESEMEIVIHYIEVEFKEMLGVEEKPPQKQ
jgi:hypothetical protein